MLAQPSNRRRLAWLLFALFALMQVNLVVFRHGHRLPDGRIITHAHPFWPDGKGPIKANPHSAGELALLDALSNGSFVEQPALLVDFQPTLLAHQRVVLERATLLLAFSFCCFAHRGPPALVSSPA